MNEWMKHSLNEWIKHSFNEWIISGALNQYITSQQRPFISAFFTMCSRCKCASVSVISRFFCAWDQKIPSGIDVAKANESQWKWATPINISGLCFDDIAPDNWDRI